MFLDPEPRRQSTNGLLQISSQTPVQPLRVQKIKRKPLSEHTESQKNAQKVAAQKASLDSKPTVRLVRPSSSFTLLPTENNNPNGSSESLRKKRSNNDVGNARVAGLIAEFDKVKKAASAPRPCSRVSEVGPAGPAANEAPNLDIPPSTSPLPSTLLIHDAPNAAAHRRSTSSGNFSNSSTLKGSDTHHTSSYVRSEPRRSQRLSEGTTLRGSVTPHEQDHRERLKAAEAYDESRPALPQGPAQALQTLQETSPERTTIRAVPPSSHSSASEHRNQLRQHPSESSLHRRHSLSSAFASEIDFDVDRPSSRRTVSTGSIAIASAVPLPLTIHSTVRRIEPTLTPYQRSRLSLSPPAATSSPNFKSYYPESTRPRSRSQPISRTTSFESIQSRLEYPYFVRPDTGRSLARSNSFASLQHSASYDTLPPLHIPKKRLRSDRPPSRSRSASSRTMDPRDEEIDTLPYPRPHFSAYLSTIASESSRSNSRHLSHFSLGSGVETGDDASSIWPRGRSESLPLTSSAVSPLEEPASNEEEIGDMTIGTYRAESAKPEPLFRGRQPDFSDVKYDGPLPPLPPIPRSRHSDENFDTLSELAAPSLRKSRSGYSLRQRSNSTPSHSRQQSQISYVDSERWSHGSSLFPTWAKNFYGGTANLLSASKVSLSNPASRGRDGAQNGQRHLRTNSAWTERSITSHLGARYSEIETGSPTSSHFLPSIFRARTRQRANTDSAADRGRRSKRSRPSRDDDSERPDSLAIFANPFPQNGEPEVLPSGQPKFGTLKDGPPEDTRRPLPRKYSKQKQWNEMTFPRPMTKDRLSDFGLDHPHLAPTKRQTRTLNAWHAPSFVDSIDTLFKSRTNRQITLFALGFLCPLLWMLGAILPLPPRPSQELELEKSVGGSEENVSEALRLHEAGDAAARWAEERKWLKGKWWRSLNRVMSVIGVLIIGAVIALAVVATRKKPLV